jgi:uncharacterized membrane protein
MTTSTIFSYQLSRDQLITAALRKLGVIAQGQTPDIEAITNGAMSLNTTVAELRAVGLPMWSRTEYSWIPTTSNYTIGTGQTLNTPYPVRLLEAFRTDFGGASRIPLNIISSSEYNTLPNSTGGNPIQINYTPTVNIGTIRLWPTPDISNTATVTIVYQQPFEYFQTANDTMDFPEEWYNAIIYKLAVLLASEWGIPLQDRQLLMKEAAEYIANAQSIGQEDAGFFISPSYW